MNLLLEYSKDLEKSWLESLIHNDEATVTLLFTGMK